MLEINLNTMKKGSKVFRPTAPDTAEHITLHYFSVFVHTFLSLNLDLELKYIQGLFGQGRDDSRTLIRNLPGTQTSKNIVPNVKYRTCITLLF